MTLFLIIAKNNLIEKKIISIETFGLKYQVSIKKKINKNKKVIFFVY